MEELKDNKFKMITQKLQQIEQRIMSNNQNKNNNNNCSINQYEEYEPSDE